MFIFSELSITKACLRTWGTLYWIRVADACKHIDTVLFYEGETPEDLIPPSHFASSAHSAGTNRCVQMPATQPPISWINQGMISVPSSGEPSPANPWLAINQAQQEILELRKENQRILMLQGDSIRTPDYRSDCRARYIHYMFYMVCHLGGNMDILMWSLSFYADQKTEEIIGLDGNQSGDWRQKSTRLKQRG